MPLLQSRRFRFALWLALAVLALPVALSVLDLTRGDERAWLRLGSLAVVVAILGFALRRQAAFERRTAEQLRTQEALRASEAKFAGILSIAADAIISVDERQRIVHFNQGAEEIFGHAASDAIGRDLNMLIPVRYRTEHPAHMERFGRSGVAARRMGERREIFGLRSDGTEFPAEASISKLSTPDGMLFTVVLRDITAQKRAAEDERFLSDASAQLARSLDLSDTAHAVADLAVPHLGDVAIVDLLTAEDQFTRVVSRTGDAALAGALAALAEHRLHVDSPSPAVDVIRRGRTELVAEVTPDWLEASTEAEELSVWRVLNPRALLVVPLRSGEEVVGALTLARASDGKFLADTRAVAEQYAAAAAWAVRNARLYDVAQRATLARDEVLGVVSHDLRNPISAIAMCARTLQESPPADAAQRGELLLSIRESTEWMNRLIQDLLDVANLERGRLSLDVAPTEPAQIVLQARHMFEVEAAQHGIALEVALPTNLPLVAADGARVVQVLGNLLRNAIKFTPGGGRITVAVRPEDGSRVVFAVRDTGPGIPLESQPRVFDRYWQASDGARAKGSGLGLSIARGIVEAHGGRIWLRSTPGAGATFEFSIPVAPEPRVV